MTCEHKWEVGDVIWVENKPKIKTKCILCNKDIIINFGLNNDFSYESRKELMIAEIKKRKRQQGDFR